MCRGIRLVVEGHPHFWDEVRCARVILIKSPSEFYLRPLCPPDLGTPALGTQAVFRTGLIQTGAILACVASGGQKCEGIRLMVEGYPHFWGWYPWVSGGIRRYP